jgi:transcriptional regulator with XRE-family HTH domain
MELSQKIANTRKQNGLTQEQLADLSNVTVRTIQRIENGSTIPRAYTLKTIAAALDLKFEELVADNGTTIHPGNTPAIPNYDDSKHFLKVLCLSCFSYLVVPFVHFLIPGHLLKKSSETNLAVIAFAKKVIRTQLYWIITLWLLLLLTLAYNMTMAANFQKSYLLNYLVPFFAMYFINAVIISIKLAQVKKMDLVGLAG